MYNEILRLKDMLTKANIPFWWKPHHFDGYLLAYPEKDAVICSVIEFSSSYGSKGDLLEIQGLMTKEEKKRHDDDVLGYLTAENVFDRIKKHWDKQRRYIGVIK